MPARRTSIPLRQSFDRADKIGRMQTFGPPDSHYLSAAVGWFELGNLVEAKAELGRIVPEHFDYPDVLEVRWLLHAEEKDWQAGLSVAEKLIAVDPRRPTGWLHRAYARRRVENGGLQAAWDDLLPGVEKCPKDQTIPYNLACYACQLGRLDEARQWLERAVKLAGKKKIKLMALNDTDLEPLWEEIKRL